jgi:predicted mannosyl-3-phosphoglycerate phosphatase (HAD superfamily)
VAVDKLHETMLERDTVRDVSLRQTTSQCTFDNDVPLLTTSDTTARITSYHHDNAGNQRESIKVIHGNASFVPSELMTL